MNKNETLIAVFAVNVQDLERHLSSIWINRSWFKYSDI